MPAWGAMLRKYREFKIREETEEENDGSQSLPQRGCGGVNEVGTIRNQETLKEFKRQARRLGKKPYMLVLLGLNTGLRIGDLLETRVRDIRDTGYIVRREKKTGKQTEVRFHPAVVAELKALTADMDDDELLFQSPWITHRKKPIDYSTAYKWINQAARAAGIKGPIGCHTLRKTYGYWFYKQYGDVAALMAHFNHSDERVTMRYIGVTQEHLNAKTEKFRL